MRRRKTHPDIQFSSMLGPVSRTLILFMAIPASVVVCSDTALRAAPVPATSSTEPADLSSQQIEPLVIRDEACIYAAPASELGPRPIGCALGNTALGMDYSLRLEAEGHKIAIQALAAREAEGALSLDRLMFDRNPGMAEESSFTGLVADIGLFDGRFELKSSWTWTDKWLAQQEAPLFLPVRQERKGGTAQSHKLVVRLISRSGVSWSLSTEHARAGHEYSAGRLSSKVPVSVFAGSKLNFSSNLSVGRWKLAASVQNQSSLFAQAETRKLKISRGGVSFHLTDQDSAVAPTVDYPTLPLIRSGKKAMGLDIDLITLSPGLASNSRLPAVLIPRYSTFSYEERTTSLLKSGSQYRRKSFDFSGMWDSRLGDTYINYRVDRKRPLVGVSKASDDTMLYVSQSFPWGDWRFGIDAIKTANRGGVGREEFSDSLSLGGSVRYSRPKGPEFQLRVGRDNSAYEGGLGAFTSRDIGLQVYALLDITQWLRNRLERGDINLTMEYRYRMREDQLDYELFEGFFQSERDSLVRHGFLMHFGMKLP